MRRTYEAGREAGWMLHSDAPVEGQAAPHLSFVCNGEASPGNWVTIPEMPAPVVANNQTEDKKSEAPEGETDEADLNQTASGNSEVIGSKKQLHCDGRDQVQSVTGVEVAIVQRNPDRITRRPRELLVKVRLPGLSSAAGVDIKVEEKSVRVDHLGANLHAEATLPFVVDGDKGSATFDSDTSLLILTLPVVAQTEDDKNALQHLENEQPNSTAEQGDDVTESNDNNNSSEDHAMVKAQKLRGLAIPTKLGNNVMF